MSQALRIETQSGTAPAEGTSDGSQVSRLERALGLPGFELDRAFDEDRHSAMSRDLARAIESVRAAARARAESVRHADDIEERFAALTRRALDEVRAANSRAGAAESKAGVAELRAGEAETKARDTESRLRQIVDVIGQELSTDRA